jgi:hypothetical protein
MPRRNSWAWHEKSSSNGARSPKRCAGNGFDFARFCTLEGAVSVNVIQITALAALRE